MAEGEVVGVSDADGSADVVQVAVPVVEGAEVSDMASLISTLVLNYIEHNLMAVSFGGGCCRRESRRLVWCVRYQRQRDRNFATLKG